MAKRKHKKKSSKQSNCSKIKYGILPIRRVKYGDRHPHVVVLEGDNENISVGLTTSNKRGDLTPVRYSNGKKGYMKRNADRKDKYFYDRKVGANGVGPRADDYLRIAKPEHVLSKNKVDELFNSNKR